MLSIKVYKKVIFAILLAFITNPSISQSLAGPNGIFNTPGAKMLSDGTFFMGVNYLDDVYISNYGNEEYNCLAYYFDITFLPFLEVNFRNTRLLGKGEGNYTVDRMVSVRLRILKEKKVLPALVIGSNDIFTSSKNGNKYFSAVYIVGTKSFKFSDNIILLSLGNGIILKEHESLKGIFGGIEYQPFFAPFGKLILEYDTERINIGIKVILLNRIVIFALTDTLFNQISGGIAYRIRLKQGIQRF